MKLCLVLAFFLAIAAASAIPPPDLKPCDSGDSECCNTQIKALLLYILRQLGDPLSLPELIVSPGLGLLQLNKKFTNVEISGLSAIELKDYALDLNNGKISLTLFGAAVTIKADYDISGRCLLLPIFGKGSGNFELVNLELQVDISVTLGEGAIKVDGLKLAGQVESITQDYSDFYGEVDKILTPILNGILNVDNKLVVYEELPAYLAALEPVLLSLVAPILESLDPTLLLSLIV